MCKYRNKLKIPVHDNVSTKLHIYVCITDNYAPNLYKYVSLVQYNSITSQII